MLLRAASQTLNWCPTSFHIRNALPSWCFHRQALRHRQPSKSRDSSTRNLDVNYPAPHAASETSKASGATFSDLNVFETATPPASAIETVSKTGFLLSNGVEVHDGSGVLLVHNEVFKWKPEERKVDVQRKAINERILELGRGVWGLFDLVHPKPGEKTLLLSKMDRDWIAELGIRMDVMDTVHAAAQYNMLATERPQGQVAAALLISSFSAQP